jgi:cyclopropane-fatty-acyl-phospholipid synthase
MSRTLTAIARRTWVRTVRLSCSFGELTIIDGERKYRVGPGGEPKATLVIASSNAWRMLWKREGVCESYVEHLWDSPDLVGLFSLAALSVPKFDNLRRRLAIARVPWLRLRRLFDQRASEQKRLDEAMHYELGNDLFALMLDSRMMYSCAVFDHDGVSLEEAALAKLELICDKLDLNSDDTVLEIGSGWGGFAILAAQTRGCHVTTITISHEQYLLVKRRVSEARLDHLVDVKCEDYRNLIGSYDKIVSIEMIEAVGHRDLGRFFAQCSVLLKPAGTMLLQAITIVDDAYDVSKWTRSFAQHQVFPSSCLPSKRAISDCIARCTDMRILHLEDLTPHYISTLQYWRFNLKAAAFQLQSLGYDDQLQRFLNLYLSYSEAGFAVGRTAVSQMMFAKPAYRLDEVSAQ